MYIHLDIDIRRAAIYVRQSLYKEEGIERQIVRCQQLAGVREWSVVEVYEDNNTSAAKAHGKATSWARLLRDAEAKRFDVVVSVDMDRLARSFSDLLTLSNTGVQLSTTESDLDTTSADGRFRAHLLASLAEFEIRRKTERQLRANLH